MKFCEVCNNMLYISVTEENALKYYCRNCSYTEIATDTEPTMISKTVIDQDVATYKQFMTKYIKYDVTLPRVNNIKCPHEQCKDNKEADNEVIYIKYDQNNMKYMYYCCKCEQFWKST